MGSGQLLTKKYILKACLVAGLLVTASACASIKIKGTTGEQAASVVKPVNLGKTERAALVSATRAVKQTPWPRIEETSFSDRMVGALFGKGDKTSGITRDEALDIYVRRLRRDVDPTASLMRDADHSLSLARNLAESGRLAAGAITPLRDDIELLERAISDVRDCRDIYLATMKKLRSDGYDLGRPEMKEMKHAFTQTIRDIGVTADVITDRVASNKNASQYAGTIAP